MRAAGTQGGLDQIIKGTDSKIVDKGNANVVHVNFT